MSAVGRNNVLRLRMNVECTSLPHAGFDFVETFSGTIDWHEVLCGPHTSWQRTCHIIGCRKVGGSLCLWLPSSAVVCVGAVDHLVGAGVVVAVGVAAAALEVAAGAAVVELCDVCDVCLWRRSGLLFLAACCASGILCMGSV